MFSRLSCFVIMPYSDDSERIYTEGVLPALRSLREPVLALRADTMGSREITLKAHVESAVRSADFCIVDLTGTNPNVMYELGYAIAIGKPTVLIRRHGEGRLPANLMSEMVVEYDEGKFSEFRQELKITLEEALDRSNQQRLPQSKSEFYSTDLNKDLMNRLLGAIEGQLSLLVSSTEYLVKTLVPGLRGFRGSGLRLRIVSADPEGEFSRLRSQDSDMSVALYRTKMWEDLNALRSGLKSLRGVHSEVRILDKVIPNSLFITDNLVFVAPYMTAGASREAVAFFVSRDNDGKIYKLFTQEFNKAWASARAARTTVPEAIPPPFSPGSDAPPSRGGDF